MCKLGLEKAEEPEIKLPTFVRSSRKQGNSRKNAYFCFIDYAKAFDCVDHKKLWKILIERNARPLSCLLKNLYAGQEATIRTGHGTTDWFKTGKGVCQGCILLPCFFITYVQSEVKVKWSRSVVSDSLRPVGSSVRGIFQAIVLEWIAISLSRGSSQPRDRTRVSHIVDRRFTV